MRFAVLTMNPGIDRVLYFREPMRPGKMNRAYRSVTSQGSKGANVAIMLRRLGFDVVYYSFTGGYYGKLSEDILKKEKVECRYTPAACGIRVNTKVIDGKGVCTELNEEGGPVTPEETAALLEDFLSDPAETVFISGSFPQGVEKTVYKSLTAVEKERGRNVILDCAGEALTQAVVSRPDIIKPNIDEMRGLLDSLGMGKTLFPECEKDPASVSAACGKLAAAYRIGRVICTLGENGAVENRLTGGNSADGGEPLTESVFAPAVKVRMKGFSGAGDCFLAAFGAAVYGFGMKDADALRFASACGAAKVRLSGTLLPTAKSVYRLFSETDNHGDR